MGVTGCVRWGEAGLAPLQRHARSSPCRTLIALVGDLAHLGAQEERHAGPALSQLAVAGGGKKIYNPFVVCAIL